MATVVNLSNVDAQCFQKSNPPGSRGLYMMVERSFMGEWPREGGINGDGEVTELPLGYLLDAKWAKYDVPVGTLRVKCESNNDPSYQNYKHSIDFALAGFSKEVRAEARKLLNAGTVIIVEMNGGEYVVLGSSHKPVFLKGAFDGGAKGNDKRGYTYKGEAENMAWELPVLPATLVAQLPMAV